MTLNKSLDKSNPKIILAVGAHPDDIDIGCSGTVAKAIKEGGQVFYLVLTDGSKGSEDSKISNKELTKLRRAEQQKAADILGVRQVFFLDFVDGELENTHELKKQIVKIIRQIKPTTIICFDPTMIYDTERSFINHPDHRIAGQATLDAVFPFARNTRTYMELLEEGLGSHVVDEVLMTNFSKSNYFVDISSVIDLKIKTIGCHISQFANIKKFQGRIREMSALNGKRAKPKMKYAESFVRITLRQPG